MTKIAASGNERGFHLLLYHKKNEVINITGVAKNAGMVNNSTKTPTITGVSLMSK